MAGSAQKGRDLGRVQEPLGQAAEHFGERRGQGRAGLELAFGPIEAVGVEELAFEALNAEAAVAVAVVAGQGVSGGGGMDADLMHAAGFQFDFDQRRVAVVPQRAKQRARLLAAVVDGDAAKAGTRAFPNQGRLDFDGGIAPAAAAEGQIAAADATLSQGLVESQQGRAIAGQQQAAAGVAVEAMAEQELAVLAPEDDQGLAEVGAEAAAAVNGEAGGFVDDDDVGIAVDHGVADPLGQLGVGSACGRGGGGDRRQADVVVVLKAVGSLDAAAVDADLAAAQQLVHMAFGHAFEVAGEEVVDALAGAVGGHLEVAGAAVFVVFHRSVPRRTGAGRRWAQVFQISSASFLYLHSSLKKYQKMDCQQL